MKNTVTNICGLIVAVCGSLLVVPEIPGSIKIYLGVATAIATGIIGYFTGKTPPKTPAA